MPEKGFSIPLIISLFGGCLSLMKIQLEDMVLKNLFGYFVYVVKVLLVIIVK
jgi:hypothetical protein